MASTSTPPSSTSTYFAASSGPRVTFSAVNVDDSDDSSDDDGGTLARSSQLQAIDDDDSSDNDERDTLHTTGSALCCTPRLSRFELLRVLLALLVGVVLALCIPPWFGSDRVTSIDAAVPPSALHAAAELSSSEVEAAFLLTGLPTSAASSLSPSTRARLRRALDGVAMTVLAVRPAMQRLMWVGDCQSFLPCPFPSSAVLSAHPTRCDDADVYAHLVNNTATITTLHTLPSSSTIFPPPPPPLPSPSPSPPPSSFPPPIPSPLLPGEPLSEQSLTLHFHSHLHSLQHPSDCSTSPLFILDFFHTSAGLGSWSHARGVGLATGFRMQRVTLEAPRTDPSSPSLYMAAYSNCTRQRGLGGCDIFLPPSSCELPEGWKGLMEEERVNWVAAHPEWVGVKAQTFGEHLDRFRGRRWVAWSEVRAGYVEGMEWLELHHAPPPETRGWEKEQLAMLPEPLAYLRAMPECWWQRQALAYHFRTTRVAQVKLLTLVAQSLQMPDPQLSAATAQAYADARSPAPTHTAQTWLGAQALKTQWQVQQLDATLIATLRHEMGGAQQLSLDAGADVSSSSSDPPTPPRLPLLGHMFIRHGDKAMENALVGTDEYVKVMQRVAVRTGVWGWYVGSDELLAPTSIRQQLSASTHPLQLYTNAEVDRMSAHEKQHSPVAGGWDLATMARLTDADREASMWRSLVDLGMGWMADVFVSTWSSNHPRLVYELATAMSGVRGMAPFVGLDSEVVAVHLERTISVDKKGKVDGC